MAKEGKRGSMGLASVHARQVANCWLLVATCRAEPGMTPLQLSLPGRM
jgi:hypothetical protein